jgi:hypothetical protein
MLEFFRGVHMNNQKARINTLNIESTKSYNLVCSRKLVCTSTKIRSKSSKNDHTV